MRSRHFTLLELLAVMAIIAILSGLVIGVSGFASRRAATAKTIGSLQSMEVALQMYLSDQGYYPATLAAASEVKWARSGFVNDQNVCYLDNYPPNLNSPYEAYKDAWHEAFFYECPGTVNTESYDLWSRGPDKKHGDQGDPPSDAQVRGDEASDDINNWRRN